MKVFESYSLVYLYVADLGWYTRIVYKKFKVILSVFIRLHLKFLYSIKLLDEI